MNSTSPPISPSITAVIITLNEQSNIERCLKSLSWADEILVYDSGSTDQTVKIAESLGAKVIQGPWLGFGSTKHKACEASRNVWIFSIDADEVVPTDLQKEILSLKLDDQILYKVPRLSWYLGKWIRFGGWTPDYQNRLFNKNFYQWNHEAIHEKVEPLKQTLITEPKIQALNNQLQHYVFKNIEHQVQTNNKYSSLQAAKMFQDGKVFNLFHFMTKPYVKFIECYILKLGFLDGWAGYVIARNAAYSVLLKWTKLKELHATQK